MEDNNRLKNAAAAKSLESVFNERDSRLKHPMKPEDLLGKATSNLATMAEENEEKEELLPSQTLPPITPIGSRIAVQHGSRIAKSTAKVKESVAKGASLVKDVMSPDYITRDYPWAKTMAKIVDNNGFKAFSYLLTLIALFALDFTYAFLSPVVDDLTYMIIFISFICLGLEITLTCICKKNYFLGFYFWLDLIGTLSLVTDVPWLLGPETDSGDDLTVARASRVSRIARSARSVRIVRLVRIVRMVRDMLVYGYILCIFLYTVPYLIQVRVIKLLKFFGHKTRRALAEEESKPSKVGLRLIENVSRKVIVLVLLLMVCSPLLDSQKIDNGGQKEMGLQLLHNTMDMTALEMNAKTYSEYYGNNVIWLNVRNVDIQANLGTGTYRAIEWEKYYIHDIVSNTTSTAFFSLRDDVYLESAFNMILTIIVIIAFGAGTLMLTRDANVLVVRPIERMTNIVRKLAGKVFFLTNMQNSLDNGDDEDGHNYTDEEAANYETAVVESLVDKMAAVFSVSTRMEKPALTVDIPAKNQNKKILSAADFGDESETGFNDDKMDKDNAAPITLTTLVKGDNDDKDHESGSNVDTASVSIDIDASDMYNDDDVEAKKAYQTAVKAARAGKMIPIDFNINKELRSLGSVLANPQAYMRFREAVCSSLSLELLLFYQEVQKYKIAVAQTSNHIYRTFVKDDASQSVAIIAAFDRRAISQSVSNGPWIGTFDQAEHVVAKELQIAYERFLMSPFCQSYLKHKFSSSNTNMGVI